MKFILIFALLTIYNLSLAQNNYEVEWESPWGGQYYITGSIEKSNTVPEIVCFDQNGLLIYDGATHELKYTYQNLDTGFFNIWSFDLKNVFFDANSDGISEVVYYKSSYYLKKFDIKIINIIDSTTYFENTYPYTGSASIVDVDGDGYFELIVTLSEQQLSPFRSKIIILSTPARAWE